MISRAAVYCFCSSLASNTDASDLSLQNTLLFAIRGLLFTHGTAQSDQLLLLFAKKISDVNYFLEIIIYIYCMIHLQKFLFTFFLFTLYYSPCFTLRVYHGKSLFTQIHLYLQICTYLYLLVHGKFDT